jgi:energy-coupling factor transport system ATP-binding protein
MMQLLNGLTKPTSGKIFLDGQNINIDVKDALAQWSELPEYSALTPRQRKKSIKEELKRRGRELCFRVGLVMQYPEYQLFEETVYRDIAYGPTNMGLSPEEVDKRVREAARFTGIADAWLDKSPFDLSGGQKRRVSIAGVMAMKPEVLVLDEPAAGLDPKGRRQIFDTVMDYQKETGTTVLIVSHSMEDMAQYCDEIVVLSNGKIILQGDREAVFSQSELLEQVGLDIPQVTRLARILRDGGIDLPKNIYTVDRAVELLCEQYAILKDKGSHI